MAEIQILSEDTIDKIAAGEVVERPMSVVKELVENAMDAGSAAVTVEIKNGGMDLIRVTDNGKGIAADEVRIAFARHATSKIRSVEDLHALSSMGFRGEALSSIAAVSQVEVVTKTREALTGIRYTIEGAIEKDFEEIGAPDGTTFLVRNLFYNTPVRRKFLKQPPTEGSYVAELLERLALSRPDISFKFINNGQVKFQTSGNGDLKEVIYRIYGREIAGHLLPIEITEDHITLKGFLGKPEINRSNRNFEHYFINARYVKSKVLAKAIEEGYRQYVMQHKFPFVVLHFAVPSEEVDVNVHPTKMEVRFSDEQKIYKTVVQGIISTFRSKELITAATLEEPKKEIRAEHAPVYEKKPDTPQNLLENMGLPTAQPVKKVTPFVVSFEEEAVAAEILKEPSLEETYAKTAEQKTVTQKTAPLEQIQITDTKQETLFEAQFLSEKAKESYEILGQIFGTYWLVGYSDRLYMIDQHAAHEKVKYERLVKAVAQKEVLVQHIMPPVILTCSAKEEQCVLEHMDAFVQMGFELEEFGDHTFCLRGVPVDLYGCSYQELFREMLDEMMDTAVTGTPEVVLNKLASMACKAAVKGNTKISKQEAVKLIDELLTLENPYHCPHGRPTIISMTKQEIEKKFKRIV